MNIDELENLLAENAKSLKAAEPDLFDAMIAADRGPTYSELEMFTTVIRTCSIAEIRCRFAQHAKQRGSSLLSNYLPRDSK